MNNKEMVKNENEFTYEEAFSELTELVERLESNQHTLAETLQLFERGQLLTQHCAEILEKAELKIKILTDTFESKVDI
jgi:exodeoxyribonuclease VII small subunit